MKDNKDYKINELFKVEQSKS